MPVTLVASRWQDGAQIFHEKGNYGAIANLLTLAPAMITVGSASQDVDFKIFLGASDQYVLFDVGNVLVTFAKTDVAIAGDLTVTLEDISLEVEKYLYFDGQGGSEHIRSASAGKLTVTASGTGADDITLAGTVVVNDHLTMENAAGPSLQDSAATTTVPTLIPNKAEVDTGIGWASDTLHVVLGGVDEYSFSTSTLDMNANTITEAGSISADDAAGPIMVNEAATTTNPTLCPDRAEDDTGIGWASDTIHIVLGGVDEYSFTTSTFDMNANTITDAGNISAADAAGPIMVNEAATTTNPTLCPDRAEDDTGIGWASDEIHIALGGVDEYGFSTSGLDMNGNALTELGALGMTGALTISPTAAGTFLDFELEDQWTGGTLIRADFAGATTLGSDAIGMLLDFNTQITMTTNFDVTAHQVLLPPFSQSAENTTTIIGYNLPTAGAIEQSAGAGGVIAWRGVNLQLPDSVQTAGTVTSYGINIAAGSVSTGTQIGMVITGTMTTGLDFSGATLTNDITLQNSATITNGAADVLTITEPTITIAGSTAINLDGPTIITGLIKPDVQAGANSPNGLLIGVGTSGDPATTATASKNFYETRCQTTAATGAGRGFYLRYDIAPAAGGTNSGEAIRGLTRAGHAIASASGVSGGFVFDDTNGAISGSATGGSFTMEINSSGQTTGGLYGASAIMHFAGTGGPPTNHACLELRAAGNTTGAAKCLNAMSIVSTAGTGAGEMLYNDSVRILYDSSARWIPLSTVQGTFTTAYPMVSTSDTGLRFNGAYDPDQNRTDYAIAIGGRAGGVGEIDVTIDNNTNQNFDPIQMNVNIIGVNPSGSSQYNGIYQNVTHTTAVMSNYRIKGADWLFTIGYDILDVYGAQKEIVFNDSGITVGGQVCVHGMVLDGGNQEVSSAIWHVINATMRGSGSPVDAHGILINAEGGINVAAGLRCQGTGMQMAIQCGDGSYLESPVAFAGFPAAGTQPVVSGADASGDVEGSIEIEVGGVAKWLHYWPSAS